MTDLIPDLIMPVKHVEFKEEKEIKIIEKPSPLPSPEPPSPEEDEDDFIEPVKKTPLKNEEIFKTQEISDVPKVAPIKKKKRVLTERQKEALSKGREKAAETRLRKKQERLQGIADDKEYTELKTKKKKKDLESLRKGASETPAPAPQTGWGSKEEFDKAVNDAVVKGISGYDNIRKERKVKKKKEQAKDKQEKQIFQDISRATRKANPDDVWSVCFQ